ncbi:GerAB/ArcD/ProY family transporter [Sporosarcina sp. FSL W7-1283]|uniref:GerAB/ArcD/ProY family transporter n=1 Tax=Sporosarcina sp. FSL W7-1283 TaxID=2921560 RepID=UPI0030F84956
MSRFVYFLITTNMIANIAASLPRILLSGSNNGAITSMALALIFGVFATWSVIRLLSSFPGKTLPELMETYLSKWLFVPLLLFFAINWYVSGLATLITYSDILLRYLTPEMPIYSIVGTFILFITFGLVMKGRSVLYTLEIILVLLVPIILYFLLKVYLDRQLDWDNVGVAIMNVNSFPNYTLFTASSYIFLGFFDMLYFNKYIKKKMKFGIKEGLIVGGMGFFVLFTTYFIPIGFIGFDGIEDILYPWIVTTDSIRMKFGVVERIIFIFLLIFLAIAFLNIMIHWHVSLKFFQGALGIDKLEKRKKRTIANSILIIAFWTVSIVVAVKITEYGLFKYINYFYGTLPFLFILLMGTLMLVKRRANS